MDIENGFLVAPNDPRRRGQGGDQSSSGFRIALLLVMGLPGDPRTGLAGKGRATPLPAVDITRLVWRAINGLGSAARPGRGEPIMPAPGTHRIEGIESRWAVCFRARRMRRAGRAENPQAAPNTRRSAELVEDALRRYLLLDNENDAGKRNDLVKLLIKCLR